MAQTKTTIPTGQNAIAAYNVDGVVTAAAALKEFVLYRITLPESGLIRLGNPFPLYIYRTMGKGGQNAGLFRKEGNTDFNVTQAGIVLPNEELFLAINTPNLAVEVYGERIALEVVEL